MLSNLRDKILENEFKIMIFNNEVNIINYTDILHFDSVKIIVTNKDKTYTISGKNLIVSKLLVDELLISGDVEKIEFR